MQKTIVALAASAVLLLTASGCSNNNKTSSSSDTQTYQTALTNGKQAVSDNEFAQAEGFYKMASLIKTDSPKAGAYYKQAKALTDAKQNIADLDFEKALENLKVVTTVPNGATAMNNKAKALKKSVNQTIKTRKSYSKLYNTAKKQNAAKNFAQADAVLAQLLSEDRINQSAYADIRLDALSLKANNSAAAAQNGETTSDVPATTDSADTSANASSSSASDDTTSYASSTDATAEEQSKAAAGYSNQTGSVTSAQITKARAQLKAQGVDTAAWSDADIAQAVQNAEKDGRSTVKEGDMTNSK